jgi:hypothetical protein
MHKRIGGVSQLESEGTPHNYRRRLAARGGSGHCLPQLSGSLWNNEQTVTSATPRQPNSTSRRAATTLACPFFSGHFTERFLSPGPHFQIA